MRRDCVSAACAIIRIHLTCCGPRRFRYRRFGNAPGLLGLWRWFASSLSLQVVFVVCTCVHVCARNRGRRCLVVSLVACLFQTLGAPAGCLRCCSQSQEKHDFLSFFLHRIQWIQPAACLACLHLWSTLGCHAQLGSRECEKCTLQASAYSTEAKRRPRQRPLPSPIRQLFQENCSPRKIRVADVKHPLVWPSPAVDLQGAMMFGRVVKRRGEHTATNAAQS